MSIFAKNPARPAQADQADTNNIDLLRTEIESLKEIVTTMAGSMKEASANYTSVINRLNGMEGNMSSITDRMLKPPDTPQEAARKLWEYSDEELESFTQQQLMEAQHKSTIAETVAEVQKALEPINDQLKNLAGNVSRRHATDEFSRLANEKGEDSKVLRPDLNDWVPEMVELQKRFKDAPIEELYQLAKVRNKDKASELDNKYNPKPEEKPRKIFGGLTNDLFQGSDDGNGTMSIEEAVSTSLEELPQEDADLLRY